MRSQTALFVNTTSQVLRLSCALAGDLQYILSRPAYCRVLESFSFTPGRKCLCGRNFDVHHGNAAAAATANPAPTATTAAAGGRDSAGGGRLSGVDFVGGEGGTGGCGPDHSHGFRVRPTLYQVSGMDQKPVRQLLASECRLPPLLMLFSSEQSSPFSKGLVTSVELSHSPGTGTQAKNTRPCPCPPPSPTRPGRAALVLRLFSRSPFVFPGHCKIPIVAPGCIVVDGRAEAGRTDGGIGG